MSINEFHCLLEIVDQIASQIASQIADFIEK